MKTQTLILRLPDDNANPNQPEKGQLQICYFNEKPKKFPLKSILLKLWSWFVLNLEQGEYIHRQIQNRKEEDLIKYSNKHFPQRLY